MDIGKVVAYSVLGRFAHYEEEAYTHMTSSVGGSDDIWSPVINDIRVECCTKISEQLNHNKQ